ncbi:hypothetical protein ACLD02_04675 [Alloalcanivorax sp. C16-2]|uniref:hypothetical protein n=1 Tax=Alloalcanivorax TaxID=3020832 RepID=UPI001933F7CE|nr:hypothetical protein [Alloalcanivorax marinus]MBL7250424.1 hypothetical protein [Alloalcanivorax marinus]
MNRFTIECRQGDIANQTDMDALSTGAFGYPLAEAARIAVTTVAAEGAALAAHRAVLDERPGHRA